MIDTCMTSIQSLKARHCQAKSLGDSDNDGVALIEMAILLPLVLLFILGGLEYSRTLERAQWVSQLSREVANVTYRECAASTGQVLGACLRTRVLNPLTSQAQLLAPGTEYVVAVYSYEGGVVKEEGVEGSARYRTEFRNGGFTIQKLGADAQFSVVGTPGFALKETGLLVVATAYSPMQTMSRRIIPGMRLVFPQLIISSTVI